MVDARHHQQQQVLQQQQQVLWQQQQHLEEQRHHRCVQMLPVRRGVVLRPPAQLLLPWSQRLPAEGCCLL